MHVHLTGSRSSVQDFQWQHIVASLDYTGMHDGTDGSYQLSNTDKAFPICMLGSHRQPKVSYYSLQTSHCQPFSSVAGDRLHDKYSIGRKWSGRCHLIISWGSTEEFICVSANSTEETSLYALLFIKRKISLDFKINQQFIQTCGLGKHGLYCIWEQRRWESHRSTGTGITEFGWQVFLTLQMFNFPVGFIITQIFRHFIFP